MSSKYNLRTIRICLFTLKLSNNKVNKHWVQDVAVIKRPSFTGLFDEADALFKKNIKYKNSAEVTDEIWFFFDVETKDIGKWNDRITIIKRLRKLRKNPK